MSLSQHLVKAYELPTAQARSDTTSQQHILELMNVEESLYTTDYFASG